MICGEVRATLEGVGWSKGSRGMYILLVSHRKRHIRAHEQYQHVSVKLTGFQATLIICVHDLADKTANKLAN